MSSEVELLSCPFCGSTDLGDQGPSFTQIMCNSCGAHEYDQPSREAAIAAWNRRSASPSIGRVGVTFQQRVESAHEALFHDDPTDLAERRDRFYEEANETVQALGMSEDDAHRLVSYTFNRPPGDVRKEIGAAALTLASLCVIGGWDMMECAEADLEKLQRPETIARIRAKRSTRHGRGPLPGVDPTLVYHEEPAGDTQGAEPVADDLPPGEWWMFYDHQVGRWCVYDDGPPRVVRTGAEVFHVREVRPAPAALVSPPDNGEAVAWADVVAERKRQVEVEGWTPKHDDEHARGEMAVAAGVYALCAGSSDYRWVKLKLPVNDYLAAAIKLWPWEREWFKPKDRRIDLVKAAALLLAEIERIDRAALQSHNEGSDGK